MSETQREVVGSRYKLGPVVGKGAHSSVYRGLDLSTGALVAVKVLGRAAAKRDPELVRRFEREAEVVCRLEHPRILRIVDHFRHEQRHCIVLEWAPGGSLRALIHARTKPLPLSRVVELATDVCQALVQTSRLGIIHGDVKSANVLLDEDGRAKLSDFGIALLSGSTSDGSFANVGSLPYLSPQGLRGLSPDPRSDIWALGVLLFELAAGRRPFTDHSFAKTVHAISHMPPLRLSSLRADCPPALETLVNRMLEKDPTRRIQTATEVEVHLRGIIAHALSLTDLHVQATTEGRLDQSEPPRDFGRLGRDDC